MSSPTIFADNAHCLNQSVAAHIATTSPPTPKWPTPNSAKKRRQMPDLTRPTATPSHGAKMSMIFRDAATLLQGSRLPTSQTSPNIKKFRLPLPQARNIKFGGTCHDVTMVSSGLGSPPMMEQLSREPCEQERASFEVARHQASAIEPHYSAVTQLTKAGRASPRTITNSRLGAATSLGGMRLDKKSRDGSASLPSQIEEKGEEVISSRSAMPNAPISDFGENPKDVKYPVLDNWRSPRSSSSGCYLSSDGDDLHSTHGVPFILPFPSSNVEAPSRSDIDTWLNSVVEATATGLPSSPKQSSDKEDLLMNDRPLSRNVASLMNDKTLSRNIASNLPSSIKPQVSPSKLKQDMQSSLRASSDKENVSPSENPSSPIRPRAHLRPRTPSRSCQHNFQATLQQTGAIPLDYPLTPQGHVSLPPKRKKPRIDRIASSRAGAEVPTSCGDFTIHEDQVAKALAQLSPHVELHRKGRGPRRERCTSYWDEDILKPGSQCVPMDVDSNGEMTGNGKLVLVETKQAVQLRAEKLFSKKAESASFQIKA